MTSNENSKRAERNDTRIVSAQERPEESWQGATAVFQMETEARTAKASKEKLHKLWLAVVVVAIIVMAFWTIPMIKEHPAWWSLFQDPPAEEQDSRQ
ncbi:MAG: hypothetical protein ISN26_00430 [Betaproteobacteria bacterium AqS2]|uniref:Uncharacterized protein n=1 Tax=Candidatus Amphirhobacter heronislandensis TaxID=1732024 RepID=A0A930XX87_9GAMM|nr:hypothetical protein [Betaproteobacteria bacterium AqS2]